MKFAIIGTNFITELVLEAAKLCPEFELEAVYSRTDSRARLFAGKYGAPRVFTSLDELAACPEIEAVYVASPNSLHKEQSIQMLRSGKHVLCEKPIASNSGELEEMLSVAAKNNRLLLEAMRPAFSPELSAIKQAVSEIGTVRQALINFCKHSSRYDAFLSGDNTINTFNPEFSNGALMDLGVYCVHLMLRVLGKPDKIFASCVKLHSGVDGAGAILAEYADKTVQLQYSKISRAVSGSEIQGEKGSVLFSAHTGINEIWLYRGDDPTGIPVDNGCKEPDIVYELREFIRLAKSGESAKEQHEYSVAALAIMDEARKQCGLRYPADKW